MVQQLSQHVAAVKSLLARGLSVIVFLGFMQLTGIAEWLSYAEFDLLSILTAAPVPAHGVTIIGIDDPSFLELSLAPPLPRQLYAQLIEALSKVEAKALGIDLLFSEPQSVDDDFKLTQALLDAEQRGLPIVLAAAKINVTSSQVAAYEQQLLPIFAGSAVGFVNLPIDADKVIRRVFDDKDSLWYQTLYLSGVDYHVPPPGARLRYYAPEVPLSYVQFTQALAPTPGLAASVLHNRILLLGINTPVSGVDRFATPFAERDIAGVAVHATAINNALFNHWISKQPLWITIGSTGLVLFCLMWLSQPWRPGQAALWSLGALLLLSSGVIWQFYLGLWWSFWPTLLGAVFLYNFDAASNYWREWRRKEQLRDLFSSYVPPAVVAQLIQQTTAPVTKGEKRELTILFADLAGFTAANELMDPDEVAMALNEYFSVMTQVIHAQGGTLDKFIGDAVMAFWNAPLHQADHADRALFAACLMQKAMHDLRSQWQGTPFASLKLRIGVHTGEAAVGNMGSKARFTYTAVGDSVNTAARLESANKVLGSDILLSWSTVKKLSTAQRPPLAWLDRVLVAGKDEALDVYTPVQSQFLADASIELLECLKQGQWQLGLKTCQSLSILMAEHHPALIPQLKKICLRIQELQTFSYCAADASQQPIDFSASIGK